MKKRYEKLSVDVRFIDAEDIISTSPTDNGMGGFDGNDQELFPTTNGLIEL
ncbi:MAG: hypothetical protein IJ515_00505 [Clostridia bacterium]|nr:hypothetical protein [Clostridia bacterium]